MPLTAVIRLLACWLSLTWLPGRLTTRARQPVSMPTNGLEDGTSHRQAPSRPATRISTRNATPPHPIARPTLGARRPSPITTPPSVRAVAAKSNVHHSTGPLPRHADPMPQSAVPRLKSFLEKTLTRATPLLALLLLTACTPTPTQNLHVFAAASLREALTETADAFQRANPNVHVLPNFAGSQVLRLQIESGARADLFISANPHHVDALHRANRLHQSPTVIAANQLVLAVPADNPAGLTGLDDLTHPGRRIVMAAGTVPAGVYARRMLELHADATGQPGFPDAVLQRVISFETNVRQVAAKLELGEADAGFVYRTDVRASNGRLQVIQTPSQVQVIATYPAAVVRDAPSPDLAQRFLTFLQSLEAQAILTRHDFGLVAASAVR